MPSESIMAIKPKESAANLSMKSSVTARDSMREFSLREIQSAARQVQSFVQDAVVTTSSTLQAAVTETRELSVEATVDAMNTIKKLSINKVLNERKVRANDPNYNLHYLYVGNLVITAKYSIFSFVPKNLFYQFTLLANFYFLCLAILQLVPQISSLNAATTIMPLTFVLAVSALKEAYDDYYRHKSDRIVNNRVTHRVRDGAVFDIAWKDVRVGDILKILSDEPVPADILLISSSEINGLCYIETAELDGETNLKVRQTLADLQTLNDDLTKICGLDAELTGESPNNLLSKYEGVLKWHDKSYSLDNEKIVYRGCNLRNTTWAFGLVIFAGSDTKLVQNIGKSIMKRTHIDKLMNSLIIGIFIFLMLLCGFCSAGSATWEYSNGYEFTIYLPWNTYIPDGTGWRGPTLYGTLHFFSYMIVLNTLVPISLYVSVELLRFGHSLFINWDIGMYDKHSDTPAKARTTTLNEELGQIEYIFSDKTGTLTQNVMTFNKCSINGVSYGSPHNEQGKPISSKSAPQVDFSNNPTYEPTFMFYDHRLLKLATSGDTHVHEFFLCLAVCHNAISEMKNGVLKFQAQSPDESALLSAARNFGYIFLNRSPSRILLKIQEQPYEFELLHILEFNNVRKRMSVIIRTSDEILLYCKGADTMIMERVSPSCDLLKSQTQEHLSMFAQDGLRTLCLAKKVLTPQYYSEWAKRYHEASCAMQHRDELMDATFEEIERNMILLGASAIEDKLQEGVPETIANLAMANIKIWVLTGDKQETAINIGYSCRLLRADMDDVFIVDGQTFDDVKGQLKYAYRRMMKQMMGSRDNVTSVMTFKALPDNESLLNVVHGEFGLIINGHSLVHALKSELELLLLNTGCLCKAVICCRVTPLQKAKVVELVKNHKQTITLAIGDGANDVSMIKVAHIGIGISGKEGMQAVLASDFAIAQFRFLERLLLVHGRWSYLRVTKFLKYFFYKNFSFTLCHLWFAFNCGFSAQTLFGEDFITLFNVCYTVMPVMVLALFEQDVSDAYSLRFPKLYYPGQKDILFNKRIFVNSLIEGVVSSLVLFLVPYGALYDTVTSKGLDISSQTMFALVVGCCLITTVTLRCALEMTHWTIFNHLCIYISFLSVFVLSLVMYNIYIEVFYIYLSYYYGIAINVFCDPQFWLTLALVWVILLLPVMAKKFYDTDRYPRLTDKVRLKEKYNKSLGIPLPSAETVKDETLRDAFKETQAVLQRASMMSARKPTIQLPDSQSLQPQIIEVPSTIRTGGADDTDNDAPSQGPAIITIEPSQDHSTFSMDRTGPMGGAYGAALRRMDEENIHFNQHDIPITTVKSVGAKPEEEFTGRPTTPPMKVSSDPEHGTSLE